MALLIRIQNAWRSSCIILGRRGNAEEEGERGNGEEKRKGESVHVTVSMYVEHVSEYTTYM